MTTQSAFAPAEDSDNSTGYEVNTESVDGKKHLISIILYQNSTAIY